MEASRHPLFAPDEGTPAQQTLSLRVLTVTPIALALFIFIASIATVLLNIDGLQEGSYSRVRASSGFVVSLIFVFSVWLVAHGRMRAALLVLVTTVFAWVGTAMFISGLGSHAPIAPGLLLLIFIVGLLCGRREGILVCAIAICFYAAAWRAESLHWLSEVPAESVTRAHVLIACALGSGWLVSSFSDALRSALLSAESSAGTALKQASFLRHVTDAAPANIVEWSRDEICLFSNARFAEFLGRPIDQVIGRHYSDLMPPTAAELNFPRLRKALAGDAQTYQVSGVIDGVEHSYLMRYIPNQQDGEVISVFSVAVDVSEMSAMEKALEERTRQAEAASTAKSQFLATMSHELRTPLNGILGNAELLSMAEFSEAERKEFLGTIVKSGRHLLSLLNSVLDLATIEGGDVQLRHDEFNLAAMLVDLRISHAGAAAAKGLTITLRHDEQQHWSVLGDQQRLYQMMAILLDNAIKFSDQGEIVLSLQIPDATEPNCYELAVTDQGIGIAPEGMGKLFQSFIQVDGSASRRYEGAGLGLIKVRRLAELMGGEVSASSHLGSGSRFAVRVRLEPAQP